jgi:hypothetical protein
VFQNHNETKRHRTRLRTESTRRPNSFACKCGGPNGSWSTPLDNSWSINHVVGKNPVNYDIYAEATQSATLCTLCSLCTICSLRSLHQVARPAAIRTRHVTSTRVRAGGKLPWDLRASMRSHARPSPRFKISKCGYAVTLWACSVRCRYLTVTSKGWYCHGLSRSGCAPWHVTTVRSSRLLAPVTNWEPHGVTLAG